MEGKCEGGERWTRLKAPQTVVTEERNEDGVQKRKIDLKPIPYKGWAF